MRKWDEIFVKFKIGICRVLPCISALDKYIRHLSNEEMARSQCECCSTNLFKSNLITPKLQAICEQIRSNLNI